MSVQDLPPEKDDVQETIHSGHRAIFFGDKAVLGLHTFLKVQLWIFVVLKLFLLLL